jgi:hypothetical protein
MQHPITNCCRNTSRRESISTAALNQNLTRAFDLLELTPANEISIRGNKKKTLSKCCVDPLRPPGLSEYGLSVVPHFPGPNDPKASNIFSMVLRDPEGCTDGIQTQVLHRAFYRLSPEEPCTMVAVHLRDGGVTTLEISQATAPHPRLTRRLIGTCFDFRV